MHKTLKNWRARRSGNGMTVYGEATTGGALVKITEVVSIEPGKAECIATDKSGLQHRLALT